MKKAFAGKVNFNMGFFYLLFSMGIVYTISSPVIIEIGERIGRDISDTGLMFSFYFIGFIGGSLLNNLLTKYFNRKKLVLFFTFLVTISTFSVFFIFNYPFLLFTFFMIGISVGFIEAQASVLMIEVNRENEGLFMNL
ncbi:MAG: MFS transporter, partial [Actinobacteria bacterium]|nr:MFS transporter [Actinomycetota bacterium]